MRLTCPNCNAQYEVPEDVIPEEGRDVQCSNCEKTWFQPKHPDAQDAAETQPDAVADKPAEPTPEVAEPEPVADKVEEPASEPETAEPEPKPEEPAAPRSSVDPAVANILQQEAARESELRAKEGSGLESQPELGLGQPPEPAASPKKPATTETAKDVGQKDDLPDVDTINSSLRGEDKSDKAAPAEEAPRKSGGFIRGFALILIIGVILFMIYGNAKQIGDAVPQVEPVLKSYVSMIDQARLWLEVQTGSAAQ